MPSEKSINHKTIVFNNALLVSWILVPIVEHISNVTC